MNKPSPRRRERRSKLPELLGIITAIDSARTLRLTVSALANYPLLNELAKEAVTELQNVSAKLERLAELVANAKTRPRRRPTKELETSPPEPFPDLGDTASENPSSAFHE
jgi:hypothetical protein